MKKLIVTRHAALVEYIFECGLAPRDTEVVAHATAEQVRGRHCIGPMPMRLAALAASVTEIPLNLPPHLRRVELTLDQVRTLAREPETYVVMTPEAYARRCDACKSKDA